MTNIFDKFINKKKRFFDLEDVKKRQARRLEKESFLRELKDSDGIPPMVYSDFAR